MRRGVFGLTAQASGPAPATVFLHRQSPTQLVQEAAELFTTTFLAKEPMTSALYTCNPEVRPALGSLALASTQQAAEGGLAAVAKNSDDKISGLVLCDPYTPGNPGNNEDDPWPPALAPIEALLAELSRNFDTLRHAWLRQGEQPPGKTLHLFVLAVAPEQQRQGVATRLLRAVMEAASAQGYQDIFAEATSESQLLLEKLGFETLAAVAYCEFVHGGERPFETAAFPGAKLMWRRIDQP